MPAGRRRAEEQPAGAQPRNSNPRPEQAAGGRRSARPPTEAPLTLALAGQSHPVRVVAPRQRRRHQQHQQRSPRRRRHDSASGARARPAPPGYHGDPAAPANGGGARDTRDQSPPAVAGQSRRRAAPVAPPPGGPAGRPRGRGGTSGYPTTLRDPPRLWNNGNFPPPPEPWSSFPTSG